MGKIAQIAGIAGIVAAVGSVTACENREYIQGKVTGFYNGGTIHFTTDDGKSCTVEAYIPRNSNNQSDYVRLMESIKVEGKRIKVLSKSGALGYFNPECKGRVPYAGISEIS